MPKALSGYRLNLVYGCVLLRSAVLAASKAGAVYCFSASIIEGLRQEGVSGIMFWGQSYIYSNQQNSYKPKNENSKIAVYEIDSELINKLKNMTEADILDRMPSEVRGSFINGSFSLTKEELLDSLSPLERVILVYRDCENDPIRESEDLVDAKDADGGKKERRRRKCELEENNTAQPL